MELLVTARLSNITLYSLNRSLVKNSSRLALFKPSLLGRLNLVVWLVIGHKLKMALRPLHLVPTEYSLLKWDLDGYVGCRKAR